MNPARQRALSRGHLLILVIGLVALGIGLLQLLDSRRGLVFERLTHAGIPVTIFRPGLALSSATPVRRPVVVIGHGFAGSQQLMHPFAATLARHGIISVTFDFPGHGRNRTPLAGELGTPARTDALLTALAAVVELASGLPDADGQIALLGHSMAGDIAVRYAADRGNDQAGGGGRAVEQQEIAALVAVSPYLSAPLDATGPRRVLFIYGGLEPEMIQQQGRAAVAAVAGEDIGADAIAADRTYGTGSAARRLVIADGVEHIGVLYSATSLAAARDWLLPVFGLPTVGSAAAPGAVPEDLDDRGRWFGLYVLGVLLVAWPLAQLLPRVVGVDGGAVTAGTDSDRPMGAATTGVGLAGGAGLGAGLRWRQLLPLALVPAVLTPLLLRPLPTDFLAIVIGDYIALHFAVYGLLTGLGLWLVSRSGRSAHSGQIVAAQALRLVRWRAFAAAVLAVALFETLLLTLPTDRFIASFIPGPERLGTVLVLFVGTLVWALSDEWLTRGPGAPRGAYALTKALFLVSLMLAVALNLGELFFLVIVIPAILALFVVYGLFSGWVYRRTGHPAIAALTNALAFAIAVAVSFPLVG